MVLNFLFILISIQSSLESLIHTSKPETIGQIQRAVTPVEKREFLQRIWEISVGYLSP